MPPHHRRTREETDSGSGFGQEQMEPERRISGKGEGVLSKISSDIRALNSSILVISQKIKYLVRNEKILGRNLLVLNKKIKVMQESHGDTQSAGTGSFQNELAQINKRLEENAEAIAQLQSDVENIKQNYAKAEQVSEIKYVIDSINPLEFVTIKDMKEIAGEKSSSKSKK